MFNFNTKSVGKIRFKMFIVILLVIIIKIILNIAQNYNYLGCQFEMSLQVKRKICDVCSDI